MKSKIAALFVVLALAVTVAACQKKGAMEQMGADADKAMGSMEKDADKAMKKMDGAMKEAPGN